MVKLPTLIWGDAKNILAAISLYKLWIIQICQFDGQIETRHQEVNKSSSLDMITPYILKIVGWFNNWHESNLIMDSPTEKTKIRMVKPYKYIVE